MEDHIRRAVEFLKRDALRNIVLLKTISYYPQAVRCHFREGPAGSGVLLILPGEASFFDRHNYPGTDHVVLIAATGPAVVSELLPHVPGGVRLLFKLMDPGHAIAAAAFFSLERVNAFVSFTSPPGQRYDAAAGVTISDRPVSACLELYAAMGHSRHELKAHFDSRQGLSFTVYEHDQPLATCFTIPNYGTIYEIGGLYTAPALRRRGLARRVVQTALHHLMHAGCVARYQAQEDNRASTRLAESIGLKPVVTYQHWRHDPHTKEKV